MPNKLYGAYALALATCLAGAPLSAQTDPVLTAAERLNTLTQQPVAQQTLVLGTLEGSAHGFTWTHNPPPNVKPYKTQEEGGPAGQMHAVVMGSFDMRYDIQLIGGKPKGLSITLTPTFDNEWRQVPATAHVNMQGTLATIAFHPTTAKYQKLTIHTDQGDTSITIRTVLQPHLGAFVTPYMLIGIVYQPPGQESIASYELTNTIGSSMSFGVMRSTGTIKAEKPGWFLEDGAKVLNAIGPVLGPYGTIAQGVASIVGGVGKQMDKDSVTVTRLHTEGTETMDGWSTSLTVSWSTSSSSNYYPGGGDVYVVLRNVLWVYAVVDNEIHLAPVRYAYVASKIARDLTQSYSSVAPSMLALDPFMNAALMPSPRPSRGGLIALASAARPVPRRSTNPDSDTGSTTEPPPAPGAAPRFEYRGRYACQHDVGQGFAITRSQLHASSASETNSVTRVQQAPSFIKALFTGNASMPTTTNDPTDPGQTVTSVSYSTTTQHSSSEEQAATGKIECGPNEPLFWVDAYVDNLFGSMLWVKDGPYDDSESVSGVAYSAHNAPARFVEVALTMGGQRYAVLTDANGNFRFNNVGMGTGTLTAAGGPAISVRFAGAPVRNQRLVAGSPLVPIRAR